MRPHASQPTEEQRRLDRPKLLIVDGSGFDATEAEKVLESRFEIVRTTPGDAMDSLRSSDARVILAATGTSCRWSGRSS